MSDKVSKDKRSSAEPQRRGLIQVYTGEGKGKTTAALGTVLRAVGHNWRVYVVFFMKGNYPYGEQSMLARLPNVTAANFGFPTFTDPANVKPEEKAEATKALAAAREAMLSGNYDLVVLDEVNVALAWKLVALDEVLSLIDNKPPDVELILTGRHADQKVIDKANLVTEMRKVKHPYDKGILAREGIEY